MELNERLKELRVSRELTQEQAAQVLEVSAQVVSKWGHRSDPAGRADDAEDRGVIPHVDGRSV